MLGFRINAGAMWWKEKGTELIPLTSMSYQHWFKEFRVFQDPSPFLKKQTKKQATAQLV